MSDTLDQAFIDHFGADVQLAYQRKGSLLQNTIRTRKNVIGKQTRFQKAGKGTASSKTRHGKVPRMNAVHSSVDCVFADWYAGDFYDFEDMGKTNINERQVIVDTAAGALGRKVDSLIIAALDGTTNIIATDSTGLTKVKVLSAFETLNGNDVPANDRYFLVGAHQWNELLNISEFANSDFVVDKPWTNGVQIKNWLGFNIIMHSGLPLDGSDRKCFAYQKTAAGWGENRGVKTWISWENLYASHFADSMLSGGACLIDDSGVVEISCDDDAAIS